MIQSNLLDVSDKQFSDMVRVANVYVLRQMHTALALEQWDSIQIPQYRYKLMEKRDDRLAKVQAALKKVDTFINIVTVDMVSDLSPIYTSEEN